MSAILSWGYWVNWQVFAFLWGEFQQHWACFNSLRPGTFWKPLTVGDVEASTTTLGRWRRGPGLLCWLLHHLPTEEWRFQRAATSSYSTAIQNVKHSLHMPTTYICVARPQWIKHQQYRKKNGTLHIAENLTGKLAALFAAGTSAKCQSDWKAINLNLAVLKLHNIITVRRPFANYRGLGHQHTWHWIQNITNS